MTLRLSRNPKKKREKNVLRKNPFPLFSYHGDRLETLHVTADVTASDRSVSPRRSLSLLHLSQG